MKIAPVSGDLLVKLGLGVVLLGGLSMLIWTVKGKMSARAGQLANVADAVNPNSTQNLAYEATNGVWSTVLPNGAPGHSADGSWSLGAFLWDVTHPASAWEISNVNRPTPAGGGWNTQITPIEPYVDAMGNIYH